MALSVVLAEFVADVGFLCRLKNAFVWTMSLRLTHQSYSTVSVPKTVTEGRMPSSSLSSTKPKRSRLIALSAIQVKIAIDLVVPPQQHNLLGMSLCQISAIPTPCCSATKG
jgi:hypothetical protein